MAGLGSRFADAGYDIPKPLLPIHQWPMYSVVLANVWPPHAGRVILVARREFRLADSIAELRRSSRADIELIEIDYTTRGAADTVQLAQELLDDSQPLVIANSDQFVDADLTDFFDQLNVPGVDGCILTMQDDDPKWSYVSLDADSYVKNVVEKEVISSYATVGIYGFSRAELAWKAFAAMRSASDTVNGEYYVAPAYNQLIRGGSRVSIVDLGPIKKCMYGMGIPTDYQNFLHSSASVRGAVSAEALWTSPGRST